MGKAKKEFLIAFAVLVLTVLILRPLLQDVGSQIRNVKIDFKEAKVLPSDSRYRESPFVFDYVGSQSQSGLLYEGEGLEGLSSAANISYRFILDKGAVLSVKAKLKDLGLEPKLWLYASDGKLISAGLKRQTNVAGEPVWDYPIDKFDLYKLQMQFDYKAVAEINYQLTVPTNQDPAAMIKKYFDKSLKVFDIKLDYSQMQSYKALKKSQEANWTVPIGEAMLWRTYPSPKGRVVARMRSPGGNWSLISLGLAGRNEAHAVENSILSSLDVRIVSGELIYGLKKFKLYSLKSKNYLRDFSFENILRDHGGLLPRQDIVKVKINGQDFGYMELLEGVDSHLFEYAQRQEGAIMGYDVDEICAVPYESRLKEKSYFKRKKNKTIPLHEPSFAKNICDDTALPAMSFAIGIAGFHGMSQADLRFHLNKRKDCHDLMIRDTNSGLPMLSEARAKILTDAMFHFAHFAVNWRPLVASHSSNFVLIDQNGFIKKDPAFFWWHATPPALNYLATEGHFDKVLDHTKLWDKEWSKQRQIKRFINAYSVISPIAKEFSRLDLSNIVNNLNRGAALVSAMPKFYDKSYTLEPYTLELKKYIAKASKNEVKPSDNDLKILNWRNQQVDKLTAKMRAANRLDLGLSLDYHNLIKYLYRSEENDYSYLFFIVRNPNKQQEFKFRLDSKDSELSIHPYKVLELGSEELSPDKYAIILNRFQANEKLMLISFKIPREQEVQYFIPRIEGKANYWGVREYMVVSSIKEEQPEPVKGLPSSKLFSILDHTIKPKKSKLDIKQSLYIPESYILKIDRDTELSFAKDACIEIRGTLDVANNARLSLTGINGAWQGIHVHGAKEIQNISISDLGTGEYGVTCFGRPYSGGFSVYNSKLSFKNIVVNQSHVEDSIHFLNSQVTMSNVKVNQAQSDSIDADFCVLIADNIDLSQAGSDGLDISGSYAVVSNSSFSNNADKGISVGENSNLVSKSNKLANSHFGIAVKDSSTVKLSANKFINNDYGLVYYAKKPYFSIPRIDLAKIKTDNLFENNKVDIENLEFNPKP